MNRSDFQQLTEARVADAKALFEAECWPGLYYIAGYAVECALKACIAKLTKPEDFPDKDIALKCFTHNLATLVLLARLKDDLDSSKSTNPTFANNWEITKDWNEQSRYEHTLESKARELYEAIINPQDGVLPWILIRW